MPLSSADLRPVPEPEKEEKTLGPDAPSMYFVSVVSTEALGGQAFYQKLDDCLVDVAGHLKQGATVMIVPKY